MGGLSFSSPSEKQIESNLESVCFDKVLEEEMKDQLWSWREGGE